MKVYEKVRAYINENGFRQLSIAQKAGISEVTFDAIITGKQKMYAEDLRAICVALNVSPELFIDVKNENKNQN